MSRRRALVLGAVHLIILAHVVQWLWTGRTLSPVEPSEAMYTLNEGHLNAGFLFFALAIVTTLLLGRFVCGWGCHFVAYQDLCWWLLKRMGIKPRTFRTRLLLYAPLALAIYMFIWPTVYRWWIAAPGPAWTNHLVKTAFWETFPGAGIGVLTVVLCGFGIVYFLGSKGFCTYACPYGGFFALADRFAVGSIRVTDACTHCGHCTAACSSHVRVHAEVAAYGMVVDPGCMKCMDCITVCPNDALYYGFGRPSLRAKTRAPVRTVPYDLALWEEIILIGVGLASLVALRGLYGQVPLLMAMGMAAITAFAVHKLLRLLTSVNERLQNLQLKRGRRLSAAGWVFVSLAGLWIGFLSHSAFVRGAVWQGQRLFARAALDDSLCARDARSWAQASATQRHLVERATFWLEAAERWGLASTPQALPTLVWLYVAQERLADAERTLQELLARDPESVHATRSLALVLVKAGRLDEAEHAYHRALALDPRDARARNELASLLAGGGRLREAVGLYEEALSLDAGQSEWALRLADVLTRAGELDRAASVLLDVMARDPQNARALGLLGLVRLQEGDEVEGLEHLRRAAQLQPDLAETQYNLGLVLLQRQELTEALNHLQRAVAADPSRTVYHYNLGVALFMAGRLDEAKTHIEAAIRLDPADSDARNFYRVLLDELGADGESPTRP